ncbi:universal stress protein [Actinophytocola sp. KF-1]
MEGAAPGLVVETVEVMAGVVPVMVGESAAASLVVLGSRGLGGFTGLLVGSTAVEVAARAECPGAVVRGAERRGCPGCGRRGIATGRTGRKSLPVKEARRWPRPRPRRDHRHVTAAVPRAEPAIEEVRT